MGQSTNNDFRNNFYSANASIPGDKHPYTGDPLFVDAGTSENVENYKLSANSPAIGKGVIILNNGGKDFFGNPLPEDANPDVGAHQFTKSNAAFEITAPGSKNELLLFPNPARDTFITLKLKEPAKDAMLTVSALNGKVLLARDLENGHSVLENIDISGYRQGMYILSLHTPAGIESERFIVY